MTTLLTAQDISVSLSRTAPPVLAELTLEVAQGETLAVLGASGTGKTTLARTLAGLRHPDTGRVTFRGVDVRHLGARTHRALRCDLQMIFQDPYSSLDPRQTIGQALAEPLLARIQDSASRTLRIENILHALALPADTQARRPHEFSGGQRQRIAIARALVGEPALVIADEAVSALDASVQARVLNILLEQQRRTGLALVFISHDMAVVRHMAHRVIVLDKGHIVEDGPTEKVFTAPQAVATRRLLQAAA